MSNETSLETLLEVRKELKDKKPDFIRQDYQRRKRLGRKLKWRKPKGIHSKIRHHFKGRRKMPSPGYRSPIQTRGLHSSGSKIVNVHSINDIKKLRKENESAIISKNVGMKKRLEILKKAKELGIQILNFNVDEQIKKIEELISSKKKKEMTIKEEKKEKKETKSKDNILEKQSEEQRKETEKKEKDKVLTKKI